MSLLADIHEALRAYYIADAGDSNDDVNAAADTMAELLVSLATFIDHDSPLPDRDAIYEQVNGDDA